MPAWLESLHALEYSLDDLKEIRALRKITTTHEWRPRTDGDYYVGYHSISSGQRKPKSFRLLLRAWDPRPAARDTPAPYTRASKEASPGEEEQASTRQEGTSSMEEEITPEAAATPSQPQLASPLDTDHATGSGQDKSDATPRFSHDVEVVALLSAAQPQSSSSQTGRESSAQSDDQSDGQGNSGSTTPANALTGRSIKVLRARRPQALATNAPDQRTFREHDPSPGLW